MDQLTHLLLDARDGDRVAFEHAIRLAQRDVRRLVDVLVDRSEVDDVVQNTFVGAWRSLHSYRAEAPGRTWLLAIARRASADSVRAASRRRRLRSSLVGLRPRVVAGDATERCELEDLVRTLPHECRESFVLTQVLGLPYADTAAACGVPIGTVRSRVARARALLIDRSRAATG